MWERRRWSAAYAARMFLLAALIATPTLADPRIDAIRAEVRAGNAERAEELAEDWIETEPDNAEAHNLYGEVLTVRINQVKGMAGRMRGGTRFRTRPGTSGTAR